MKVSRSVILDGFFILLLVALTIAFFRVLRPFLLDLFLAVILTTLTFRMFTQFDRKLNSKLAALFCVLIVLVVVAGFATLFIMVFTAEASQGYTNLVSRLPELSGRLSAINVGNLLDQIPLLNQFSHFSESFDLSTIIGDSLEIGVDSIVSLIKKGVTNISLSVVHFLLILFIMYFLYLEGPKLLNRVNDLIPLGDKETSELFGEIVKVSRATVVSTLVIGIIEGVYGSILFLIFGLPAPVFWGFVMLLVSMVPAIGTNAVLIPAGIILILTGKWISGLLIIIFGAAGISLSQYLLKPKLVGDRTGLHPVLVLLSIFGGLIWLGLVGFLVGPMIASLFIVIWNQFGSRFRKELEGKNRQQE